MKPVLSYQFYVRVLNGPKNTFLRAQSVSGLSVQVKMEKTDTLGGERKFPTNSTLSNLVIKRAIMEKADDLGLKTLDLLNKLQVKRIDLGIHLLNDVGKYTRSWNVIGAYPVKWDLSSPDVTANTVLLESIEFEYRYLKEIK